MRRTGWTKYGHAGPTTLGPAGRKTALLFASMQLGTVTCIRDEAPVLHRHARGSRFRPTSRAQRCVQRRRRRVARPAPVQVNILGQRRIGVPQHVGDLRGTEAALVQNGRRRLAQHVASYFDLK